MIQVSVCIPIQQIFERCFPPLKNIFLMRFVAQNLFDINSPNTMQRNVGKTITVISLVLQTMGLSTKTNDIENSKIGNRRETGSVGENSIESEQEKNKESVNGESTGTASKDEVENALSSDNERIFDEYWKEQIIPEFRCKALTKLFSTFLRCSREINYFFDNYWIKELQAKNIGTPSEPQLSLKSIRRRIDSLVYGDSLVGFVSDVESCFDNALSNDLVSDPIRQAAKRLKASFRSEINAFKRSQVEVAIKSFSRASARPDSMVAAMIQKNNNEKLRRALLPSSGTLMVVPAVLVDHWMVSCRQASVFGRLKTLCTEADLPLWAFFLSGTNQIEYKSFLLHEQNPCCI